MIDHWEVDGDLVTLEEELGEGAFGKVYKGVLKELSTPSRKMFTMPHNYTAKQTGGFIVAVKMLHGESVYCVLFGNLQNHLGLMNKSQLCDFYRHLINCRN